MAKQTINVGATANDKQGDSLRAAFQKVNANFTEIYTELGLANDVTLSLGAFEFTGSTMTTTDSTAIVIDQSVTVSSDLTVGGDLLPNLANGGDLGSIAKPWRSLYVSNNTVFLGGIPLSLEAGTNTLKINNVPISQNITYADIPNAPTDVADLTDIGGLLGGGADLGDLVIYDGAITTDGVSSIYLAPNGEGYGYVTVPNDTSAVAGAATVIGNSRNDGGGVQISAYNNTWQFKPDGTLTFPNQYVNTRTYNADALVFTKNGTQKAISTKQGTADTNTVERLVIAGGDSFQDPNSSEWLGEGGDVYLWAGQGGNGGDLKLDAGNSLGLNGEIGGWIKMRGGDSSSGNGGYLELAGGDGNVNGGDVTILGGTGATGVNGKVRIGTNVAYVNSTPVPANTWDFGTDGSLTLPGDIKSNGNINIDINLIDSTLRRWQFGEDGHLTLPAGGDIKDSTGTSVLGGGGSVSSLVNGAYTVSLGSTGTLTVPANGIITAPINQDFQLQAKDANSVLRNEINLDPNNGTYMNVWRDGETSFSFNDWDTGSWNNESGLGAARFTDAQALQDFWTTGIGSLGLAYEVSINGGARTPNVFYDGNNGETYGVTLGLDAVPPGGQGTTVPITSLTFYYRTQSKINIDVNGSEILLDAQAMDIDLRTTLNLDLRANGNLNLRGLGSYPVRIYTDDTTHKWEFDNTGSLTLPREGKIYGIGDGVAGGDRYGYISWDGNSSGDGSGFNTMRLVPDLQGLEDLDQYIIIDPTGGVPGHIHIRAGGTQDNSLADLYLGGENSHVKIGAGLNPPVTVKANSNSWIFGTDGRTIFPNGSVPAHSYGAAGDKEGMVVFTDPYIYYCKQDYVDNSTDIWVRVAWTGTNW